MDIQRAPARQRGALRGALAASYLLAVAIGAMSATMWSSHTTPPRALNAGVSAGERADEVSAAPAARHRQLSDADSDDLETECTSCTTCKGVSAPTVCDDGVPDATTPDPGAEYDPAAAKAWFDALQCPFARSMWVVSTLTPGHPREGHIVNSMNELTAHSTWAVLFVSTQQGGDDAGGDSAAPIINVVGRNVAVMNLSQAALRSIPLQSARVLSKLLRDRARTEWGRPDGLDPTLTAQGRLHMAVKMLPYLVAIKCGVSAIFDTVDDELPNFLPGLKRVNPDMVSGPFDPSQRLYYALPPEIPEPPLDDIHNWPVLTTPRADVAPVINPYASLGNRVIHPRGFPTEWVYNASFQVLHIQRAMEPTRPWVQQWVPHGHPDLSFTDQASLRTHLLPKLMKEAPNIVMDQWAWVPYNARGTLFLPGAFWAMFLSPAQPNHFTDTLRAYWSQRLLWDAGAAVSFRSTRSAAPPSDACGSDFGFHQERLDGHCEGGFILREVMGSRKKRVRLLAEELAFQSKVAPLLTYLDSWEYAAVSVKDTPQLRGLPDFFRKAQTLMCNLGESSQLANCKDCYALRAWLRDLVAAGYQPPADVGAKPKEQAIFPLQNPDRANLHFDDSTPGQHVYEHKMAEMYAQPQPSDRTRELAVCLSGLADRVNIRLEEEDYSLPPYKRPKVREDLLLDYNLRQLAPGFGGVSQMHHFYVMGSYNTIETNLHLILEQRLPFVAIVVHRDWVLEPLLPPDEQCHMERYNATLVQLKWTNEARHYQRSQLHQVWEEAKCFELATHFMRRHNLRYRSFMRHRSDFNITLTPFENRHMIKQVASKPEWKDTVYIPRGKDYRGINDRLALGGWNGMATYMFRWYDLRARLWETGYDDYNHLWAEPFLNFTLRNNSLSVIRLVDSEHQVLNYTEFDEIPKPQSYVGDDATRRRLSGSQPQAHATSASAAVGALDLTERLARQLSERSGDATALRQRMSELQRQLGSVDVLEEAVFDDATGERLPLMA